MTTNAGSDQGAATAGFAADAQAGQELKTQKALEGFLRPEFLNRVDEIITFRRLDEKDFEGIASIMLGELQMALAEKDIKLSFTSEAVSLIAKRSFSYKFGARNMRRFIQKEVEDRLAELLISDYQRFYSFIKLSTDGEEIKISCL
jgi:ATP-dependent Clp protease ATP-binding subunit ClpB/ATP-dependent Clp protease ATP-binding subunit ClpC